LDGHTWANEMPGGVVLDFKQLREFLCENAQKYGCDALLGWAYQSRQNSKGQVTAILKNQDSHAIAEIHAKVLVDATGSDRIIFDPGNNRKKEAVRATGIEHLIQVDPEIYSLYASSINFYFGAGWMPQGYGWIFPMEENQLKVGVCVILCMSSTSLMKIRFPITLKIYWRGVFTRKIGLSWINTERPFTILMEEKISIT